MPSFDLINLAILWSIAFLALIQTINATGAIKAAISGIITVIILVMAVFFSYMKIEGYGTFVSRELSPTAIIAANIAANETMAKERAQDSAKAEPKPAVIGMSSSATDKDAINSVERYVSSAEKIAEEALDFAAQIRSVDALPNDISEPNREKAESKALALRNATAKVNSKAASLFHPRSVSELHQKLIRATENLRLAGYALHAYTTLDDVENRKAQFEQSKRQAVSAEKAISAYKSELGKLTGK
ncbi:MAG: hypothetical protein J6Z31_08745 [Fibrobacter sp.]|nr:hypothetical protein [Fibrobacter sp.]